jgi:hypothetical protein
MKKDPFTFKASVFLYPDETAAWHFLGVPKAVSQKIKALQVVGRRGFGAVRVRATIGDTTWDTSIFPSKYSGSYLLPLKALVRKREDVAANDTVKCVIEILNS